MDDFNRLGHALAGLASALKRHIADPLSALPAPVLVAAGFVAFAAVMACLFLGHATR
jgi:hypothetical protein